MADNESPPSQPSQPARRRGAPQGNSNALKHGFYSRQFKKRDIVDLNASQFDGLKDEITMLRVFIRRIADLGKDLDDLHEAEHLLRVLCLASSSLNRLIKTQQLLFSGEGEVASAIDQAILEMNKEWNLYV